MWNGDRKVFWRALWALVAAWTRAAKRRSYALCPEPWWLWANICAALDEAFRRSMHINLSENVLFTQRLNLTDTTRSHSLHFYLHPLENVNEAGAEQRMLNEQRTRWTEKSSSNTKHTHLESFQAAAFRCANISWTSVIMKLPKGLNFIFRKCFRS